MSSVSFFGVGEKARGLDLVDVLGPLKWLRSRLAVLTRATYITEEGLQAAGGHKPNPVQIDVAVVAECVGVVFAQKQRRARLKLEDLAIDHSGTGAGNEVQDLFVHHMGMLANTAARRKQLGA